MTQAPHRPAPPSLPVDALLPEALAALERGNTLVLEAAPGTGKTTRVPPALLRSSFRGDREILVLEPRRLAAKLAARRVAEELGEEIGCTVGYQFRFENVGGAATRLRFLTEGMFLKRLLSDPRLSRAAAVVIDEFHERHLQGDVALGAVRRLQLHERPDLRLIVMSATLDAEAVAAYLAGAPRLRAEGRPHPVAIEHAGDEARRLEDRVARAAEDALARQEGDVLVFLPGQAEIRRAGDALAATARREGLLVVPLYGDLSKEEQDRAVRPSKARRKIILSTNVAETSLTIDGVRAVIDSGLARKAAFSHGTGLPALRTRPISKASAIQRAGRAGRQGPGLCIRLYSKHSYESRPPYEAPEVARADLSQTLLELKALGIEDVDAFPWFEKPEAAAVAASLKLLERLGALDGLGSLTLLGRRISGMPAHPRLARMAVAGERLGIAADACRLAALIGEGRPGDAGQLDLLAQFERDPPDLPARRAALQLERQLDAGARSADKGTPGRVGREEALRRVVLAGYPDRIGKRRGATLVLSSGGSVDLPDDASGDYFVAVGIEERSHQPGRPATRVLRSLVPVEPEWLFDLGVVERTRVDWDAQRERVAAVGQILYDGLVLDESAVDGEEEAVARCLAEAALGAGLHRFVDPGRLNELVARVRFVREGVPAPELPDLGSDSIREALARSCRGCRSFADLKGLDLVETLASGALTSEQRQQLERWAPELVSLAAGRKARVHYEIGKPPWIESRLQDFFGMRSGPSVLGGRVPLTLHLLAPNRRAVQVTSDLAGFWSRAYPGLRRELGRRYPRHPWPEDPLAEAGR